MHSSCGPYRTAPSTCRALAMQFACCPATHRRCWAAALCTRALAPARLRACPCLPWAAAWRRSRSGWTKSCRGCGGGGGVFDMLFWWAISCLFATSVRQADAPLLRASRHAASCCPPCSSTVHPPVQIMNEYQPPSQAAAQRAVRSLPKLTVRAKDATGEPGEGEALARAGEPCSVW